MLLAPADDGENRVSAYIVEKQHIIYLVAAAMSRPISQGRMSWSWKDETKPTQRAHAQLGACDYQKAVEVANMLWCENIKSVSHRYPNESSDTLPGPADTDFVVKSYDFTRTHFDRFDPVQVLKSCSCYEYQSCEHPEWEDSEAHAFIETLRSYAIHALPGYDDAAWGAPEKPTTAKLVVLRR